jgi:hypothetical protein
MVLVDRDRQARKIVVAARLVERAAPFVSVDGRARDRHDRADHGLQVRELAGIIRAEGHRVHEHVGTRAERGLELPGSMPVGNAPLHSQLRELGTGRPRPAVAGGHLPARAGQSFGDGGADLTGSAEHESALRHGGAS